MRIVLARHGQTEWNAGRRFQGAADVPLSELGRAQACALGRGLRRFHVAATYTSPLGRAVETAQLALGDAGVPIVPVEALRELSLGEWEGYTVDEVSARDGDPYRRWLEAPHDCRPPGGEALDEVCRRVAGAVEAIAARHAPDDDVLVIAHGGVISVYACFLLGCSFNSLWRLRVDNCSLTVVTPPRLVSINDTAHLEALVPTVAGRNGWHAPSSAPAPSAR